MRRTIALLFVLLAGFWEPSVLGGETDLQASLQVDARGIPLPSWTWQAVTMEAWQKVCNELGLGALERAHITKDDYRCTSAQNKSSPRPAPVLTTPPPPNRSVGNWRPYYVRIIPVEAAAFSGVLLYRAVETRQYQPLGGAEAMDVLQAFREKYGNEGLQNCSAENPTQDFSEKSGCLDQYVLYIPGRHVDGHLLWREYLIWYRLAHGSENLGLQLTVDTVGRYIELKANIWLDSGQSGSPTEGVEAIKSKL